MCLTFILHLLNIQDTVKHMCIIAYLNRRVGALGLSVGPASGMLGV